MALSSNEELMVARILREALGYESREVRIGKLKQSRYIDVRMLMKRLEERELLTDVSVKEVFRA